MNQSGPSKDEFASVEDYLDAMRNWKWVIVACSLLGLAIMWIVADSRTETFQAEAQVLLGPSPVGSNNGRLVEPNLEREKAVLASVENAAQAARSLGLPADVEPSSLLADLSVQFRPDSDVLQATYESNDPTIAASHANAFVEAFVQDRESASIAHYAVQSASLEAELAEVRAGIAALDVQIDSTVRIRADLLAEEIRDQAAISVLDSNLSELGGLRTGDIARERQLVDRLGTLNGESLIRPTAAELLIPATVPRNPTGLGANLLRAAGLLGGLVAGVVAAFVLFRLDRSVRGDSDVEEAVGAQVLAAVPRFSIRPPKGAAALVLVSDSQKPAIHRAREEYRRLRSALLFLGADRAADSQVFIVTSTGPGEGKSTTAANLAIATAQAGKLTVVVSADLRRPTLEPMFDVDPDLRGLADWLGGADEVDLTQPTDIDNLYIVPAGETPDNPAELLGSARAQSLFDELRRVFDVVIVDTPPVLSAADVLALCPQSDGVVVVVDGKKTDIDALRRVRRQLERVGSTVVGAVSNRDGSLLGRLIGTGGDQYLYAPLPRERATHASTNGSAAVLPAEDVKTSV